jgi:hypothetical protein
MGFFSDLKEEFGHIQIQNNGLPQATGWQKCEECRFRMLDHRTIRSTGHYVCYLHRMRVGSNQICSRFSKGDSEYELR